MDSIEHHLSEALLMAYAAGNLDEAFSLVVATHLSMCDTCRAGLGAFEAVGGAILEDMDGTGFEVDLAGTERRIKAAGKAPILLGFGPGKLPRALRGTIGGDLEDVRWRPAGLGVRQAILPSSGRATVRLLSIPPGVAVPDHGHRGTELTLVLQGAFRDETARFGVGDVEIATPDDEHTPTAEEGETCICLAATDAPLRFRGLMPRIAQRFLRI